MRRRQWRRSSSRGCDRPLQPRELAALVERAAVGAAGEERGGGVGVFAGAKFAAEDVAKGRALAALTAPFAEQPRAKDRRKHEHEVNEDEVAEADADHGDFGFRVSDFGRSP